MFCLRYLIPSPHFCLYADCFQKHTILQFVECTVGYTGVNCSQKCVLPTYGVLCSRICNCSYCHHGMGCISTPSFTGKGWRTS